MANDYKVTLIMENGDILNLPSHDIDFKKYKRIPIDNNSSAFCINRHTDLRKLNYELQNINLFLENDCLEALSEYVLETENYLSIFDILEKKYYLWLPNVFTEIQLVEYYIKKCDTSVKEEVDYEWLAKCLLKRSFRNRYHFTRKGFIGEFINTKGRKGW